MVDQLNFLEVLETNPVLMEVQEVEELVKHRLVQVDQEVQVMIPQ